METKIFNQDKMMILEIIKMVYYTDKIINLCKLNMLTNMNKRTSKCI